MYTALFRRTTTNATGDVTDTLATVTGGELSVATVSRDLTPPAETFDPGARLSMEFDDVVDAFGNGLCSVAVTYREAAGPAPLAAPTRAARWMATSWCVGCRIVDHDRH